MVKLPIYEAKINNEDEGTFCLSFVEFPATEVNWQAFKEDKKPMPNPDEQAQFEADFKQMVTEQKKTQNVEYPNGLQASLNDRNRHSD